MLDFAWDFGTAGGVGERCIYGCVVVVPGLARLVEVVDDCEGEDDGEDENAPSADCWHCGDWLDKAVERVVFLFYAYDGRVAIACR